MQNLISDEELEAAIANCAEEPIHIPGSIQEHGILLGLNDEKVVTHASENVTKLLDLPLEDVLNRRVDILFNEDTTSRIQNALHNPHNWEELSLNSRVYKLKTHQSENTWICEFEEVQRYAADGVKEQSELSIISKFVEDVQKLSDSAAIKDLLVDTIRSVTGFARVKLYRFYPDWSGEVVAESRADFMPSYLGLRFPESDIPKQARLLYVKQPIRCISDTSYKPQKILATTPKGNLLDLSHSWLRSVSPVHIQYLLNMEVESSMSISLLKRGVFWGLVACHHHEPLLPTSRQRELSTVLGSLFSSYLETEEKLQTQSSSTKKISTIREIELALQPSTSVISLVKKHFSQLLEAVDADGVVLFLDDNFYTLGLTPETSFTRTLIEWLKENHGQELFFSDSISRDTGLTVKGQTFCAGVLVVPVSHTMKDYVLWLREEEDRRINWAGAPEKKIEKTATGYRLSPRQSFASWGEKVRGYSRPWSPEDVQAAREISRLLISKKFEESLFQQKQDFHALMEHSSALIFQTDLEGNIQRINGNFASKFGCKPSEVIGTSLKRILCKEEAARILEEIRGVTSNHSAKTIKESLLINGTKTTFISVRFPLYDAQHDVYAVCSICSDITDLTEAKASLALSENELERMAFVAAHDLQEPVRAIQNNSAILKDMLGSKLSEDEAYMISRIQKASKRMKDFIDDTLSFSQKKQDAIETELVSIAEELQNVRLAILEANPESTTITIQTPLPKVSMKPSHFATIMQNLLSNAVRYKKPESSVAINIEHEETEQITTFHVTDNGIGIPECNQREVFQLFKRLHRHQEIPGSGIGLALCTRLCNAYGGSISVQSKEGEGSTFSFSIPRAAKGNQ